MKFSFSLESRTPHGARAGVIRTPHGDIHTPAFVPVGTKGTVKGVLPHDLKERVGAEVALGNTYHLFLQPGEDIVAAAGGLHSFMDWHGPLFTDSGGFQVFSLGVGFGGSSKFSTATHDGGRLPTVFDSEILSQHGKLALVDDDGVTFTSHIDGTLFRLTPERSIEIQHKLGADMFFAFDEFRKPDDPRDDQIDAMRRTYEWAKRSLKAHRQNIEAGEKQAIYGIVQGGRYEDLRAKSATEIGALPFDGYGIGGTFSKHDLGDALTAALTPLPDDKPRHLLGIGEPDDIFEAVSRGIDTFDCVLPTRLARTGTMYTARGKVNILNQKYARDFAPLDNETGGYASEHFSRAYVSHLFRAKEMLGAQILSMHNLYFFVSLLSNIRHSILNNAFNQYRSEFLTRYLSS